jgi:hypothetical protein
VTGGAILIAPDPAIAALLPAFLANRRRDATLIIDMLEREAFGELEDLGHRLKGQGRSYGCHGITDIGCALEVAAAQQDRAAVRRHAIALDDYLNRVLVAS